jgi:plasmid stabilization system protein ParE
MQWRLCLPVVPDWQISDRALRSLQSHDAFLRERSQRVADAVLAEIERTCGLIAEFPEMGRRIENTRLRFHISRRYRYRIVYRIEAGITEIRDVLHPSQK